MARNQGSRGGGGGGGSRGGGRGGPSGPSGREPKTIKEKCVWIYRLNLQVSQRKDVIVKHMQKLCRESGGVLDFQNDFGGRDGLLAQVIQEVTKIVACIELGTEYNSKKSECNEQIEKFRRPGVVPALKYDATNGQTLFNQFLSYLTDIYQALKFLSLMCNVHSKNGGWNRCQYSRDVEGCGAHNDHVCNGCSDRKTGCLKDFIQLKSSGTDSTHPLQPRVPLGFDLKNAQATSDGKNNISDILKPYVGQNDSIPKLLGKCLLVKFVEALKTQTLNVSDLNSNLGHFFAFWYQFGQKWNHNSQGAAFQSALLNEVFNKALSTAQGTQSVSWIPTYPTSALNDLFRDAHSPAGHSNQHHSLLSLYDCEDTSSGTCGKYMHSLLSDPFHWVIEKFKESGSWNTVFTFDKLKHLAQQLHTELEKLKTTLQSKPCVQANGKCNCIVHCDDVHAALYAEGLTLHSPKSLNVTGENGLDDTTRKSQGAKKRKCSDLKDQLTEVTKDTAPLHVFMKLTPQIQSLQQQPPPRKFHPPLYHLS